MATLNPVNRELLFKIVFYGPGLGGKTTTLQYIHAVSKPENRGNMVSLATDTDRTLYFDYLPLRVLRLRNLNVRLQLFTVPGQVYYSATRKLVLSGADGVVFVADSQSARLDANQESIDDLNVNLAEHGRSLSQIPHSFQWNKRDLPELAPLAELDRRFNLFGAPSIGTVATHGDGVFDGLEQISRAVLNAYKSELPTTTPEAGVRPPLFLDAEEVGLTEAIRELADSRPSPDRRASAPGAAVSASAALAASVMTSSSSATSSATSSSTSNAGVTAPIPPPHPTAAAPAVTMAIPREDNTPTSAPGAPFSLAELWGEPEREAVQRVEWLLAVRDARSAVLACEEVLMRVFAEVSIILGKTDHARDSTLLAAALGLAGPRFLAFRTAVRAARKGHETTMREALACYLFTAEARMLSLR